MIEMMRELPWEPVVQGTFLLAMLAGIGLLAIWLERSSTATDDRLADSRGREAEHVAAHPLPAGVSAEELELMSTAGKEGHAAGRAWGQALADVHRGALLTSAADHLEGVQLNAISTCALAYKSKAWAKAVSLQDHLEIMQEHLQTDADHEAAADAIGHVEQLLRCLEDVHCRSVLLEDDPVEKAVESATVCTLCGSSLKTGYSWRGLCVACAEPHLAPEEAAQ